MSYPIMNLNQHFSLTITVQKCHYAHNSPHSVVAVTEVVQEAPPGPAAPGHLAAPLGDSDDDASYRSSSAGDEAWSRGAAGRVEATRGHLSPS